VLERAFWGSELRPIMRRQGQVYLRAVSRGKTGEVITSVVASKKIASVWDWLRDNGLQVFVVIPES